MSKDTLRFLFRQLADATKLQYDERAPWLADAPELLDHARARWYVQSFFNIESLAGTLKLPALDPIYRFDGHVVAFRGDSLLGRMPDDNPINPVVALGTVQLVKPPQWARHAVDDEVVIERLTDDVSQYPKVYYRGMGYHVVLCELCWSRVAKWAADWAAS
ncbi:MAG: hypothetical protein KatS3mg038_2007 [Candidatus Kapaibacterium sp.]|nr:MAG: hypothetical protein KatS3mg038_2007 [Candidatus Kapabacteria bacterium]